MAAATRRKTQPRRRSRTTKPTAAEAERERLARFWHERRNQGLLTTLWGQFEREHAPGRPADDVPAIARSSTTPRGRKLTPAVWAEHLRRHPLDRLPDGQLKLGAPRRTQLLKTEQAIDVHRVTVQRRLGPPPR